MKVYVKHRERRLSYELDARRGLEEQIAELAGLLESTDFEDHYVLCSSEQTHYLSASGWDAEASPRWLQPGCELLLVLAPSIEVRELLEQLDDEKVDNEEKKAIVFALQKTKLRAAQFAEEFILQDGLPALLRIICDPDNEGSGLQGHALQALRQVPTLAV